MKFKCMLCDGKEFENIDKLKFHAWMVHDRKQFEQPDAHGSWE